MRWRRRSGGCVRSLIADVARTAGPHGFIPEDITVIKNHIFHDRHLLDRYGDAGGDLQRFDSNPRMAEAWQRLTRGTPHPEDIVLLKHELHEARYMADNGTRSYHEAHEATLRAGLAWDPEAAARDGVGWIEERR